MLIDSYDVRIPTVVTPVALTSERVVIPDTVKLDAATVSVLAIPVNADPSIAGNVPVKFPAGMLVKFAPEPENEVAVKIPTPKIFLLLPFKSPPSLGVVSPRIVVVIPVSEVNG